MTADSQQLTAYRRKPRNPRAAFLGVLVTIAVHLGIVGTVWFEHARAATRPPLGPGTYVDAQLVKFGRPRDLSFLPHKQGQMKPTAPPEAIKVARTADDPPAPKKPAEKVEIDPLKRTHAEAFKRLTDDDQPPIKAETGGSLSGSRAGTATEARGDPYILSLIDVIGSAWRVPTTIKESELAGLSADVCLTIDEAGKLVHFEFTRRSGSSQFDSSLEATLGIIHQLPAPPERFASAAARGRLCPTFSRQ